MCRNFYKTQPNYLRIKLSDQKTDNVLELLSNNGWEIEKCNPNIVHVCFDSNMEQNIESMDKFMEKNNYQVLSKFPGGVLYVQEEKREIF